MPENDPDKPEQSDAGPEHSDAGAEPSDAESPESSDAAEQPQDATPEEDAAAPEPSEEPESGATPESPAEAQGEGEAGRTAAEDLAAEALRAAQEAVTNINTGDADDAGSSEDAASADADAAMAAMMAQQAGGGDDAQPVNMPSFQAAGLAGAAPEGIDLLSDVNLDVKIELGRTRMFVEDVLRLSEGAVVELDKLAGDPVDIYVNQRLVARGEVLILNDNFCVRINDIVPSQREAAG